MSSERQERLYLLLAELQEMTKELPIVDQQRIPNELLSSLASALVEGTHVLAIVHMLMEVQHAKEKQLYHQRLQLEAKLRDERQKFSENFEATVSSVGKSSELEAVTARLKSDREALAKRQADELRQHDCNTIMQLDQACLDQQSTLEKAGVPGFHVTNDSVQMQTQRHLLNFMLRLHEERHKFFPQPHNAL